MHRCAVAVRHWNLSRPFTTTVCFRAVKKVAQKLTTDEYGVVTNRAHRRPLPKLARDGSPTKQSTPVREPVSQSALASSSPEELASELDDFKPAAANEPDSNMSTLESSIRRDMAKYPDAILLTQVGSFYESYFEQAPLVARLLSIKLTSKLFGRGSHKTRQPFAGFPLGQLMKHTATLVEAGHRVVIVDEMKSNDKETRAIPGKTRRVARIVTPGTVVDEGMLKGDETSFVLALDVADGKDGMTKIGLAYRDISTGASFTKLSSFESLRDDLLLVDPREVVLDERLGRSETGRLVLNIIKGEQERESLVVSKTTLDTKEVSGLSIETRAEQVLQSYLTATLVAAPPPRTAPTHVNPTEMLQMDSMTLKSLEIKESLRGGTKGSLLGAIRRTSTPGGARLLQERLCAPSTILKQINARLSLVSAMHEQASTRRYLVSLLKTFDDSQRLLQRLYLGRGSPFDLLGLKRFIEGVQTIRHELEASTDSMRASDELESVANILERLEEHASLAQQIEMAVDEDALVERTKAQERKAAVSEALGSTAAEREEEEKGEDDGAYTSGLWGKNEPWAIKPAFLPQLQSLHKDLKEARHRAFELQSTLQRKYELPGLTLRVAPKLGAIVHVVSKGSYKNIEADEGVTSVGKSGSTRSYNLGLHHRITRLIAKMQKLEDQTLKNLVVKVVEHHDTLLSTANAVSELDVALGFAEAAEELDLVRPIVDDDRSTLSIIGGRHLTVERALTVQGRAFTPNDVRFEHPDAFVHVLTGPNMAGKSTYLRQTALIAILAQAGSFVPAERVEMGVIDKVFSRVGARDELDRDRSTFMIEMDEATSILNLATENSLVLLDELGRGTSPLDGLAIAYAALEHLVHVNKSKTLFATHYHRLGELLGYDQATGRGSVEWRGVEFWCTDVLEEEDSVTYLHNVRRGLNDDSAGLVIARLSGMPQRAINIATKLRDRYRAASDVAE
ncbi:hypothetical protein OIO90_001898 [Microbotryomycetes sp. JL221]|nr:hypothetical protein OIO90_001898 [Microbotryomycetes sp. JL221]